MSVLICDNITKLDQNHNSIKNFSYNFLDNKIYAIVGKSDSGKDTLLNLMTAKSYPNEGCIYLDGKVLTNDKNLTSRFCFISKNTTFASYSTIKTILKDMSKHFPKWDNFYAYELLEHFRINPNDTYLSLLDNQKKLLSGIISLASLANITFLDDTVNGVDIKDRYDFFNFLYKHHERYPRTIIIVSDFIDEIDYLFDKILFLDKGKLIEHFTNEEIKNNFRYLTGKSEVLKSLINGVKVIGVEKRSNTLTVCVRKKLNKDDVRKFQKYLIKISEVPVQKVFIYLVNLIKLKEGILYIWC